MCLVKVTFDNCVHIDMILALCSLFVYLFLLLLVYINIAGFIQWTKKASMVFQLVFYILHTSTVVPIWS